MEKGIDYIKKRRSAGASDEEIRKSLRDGGWTDEHIERTFRAADLNSSSPKISKSKKIILGIATLFLSVSIISILIYSVVKILSYFSPNPPESLGSEFYILVGLNALLIGPLSIILLAIYIGQLGSNPNFSSGKKLLWVVGFLFLAPITMPIFWYLYVWRKPNLVNVEEVPFFNSKARKILIILLSLYLLQIGLRVLPGFIFKDDEQKRLDSSLGGVGTPCHSYDLVSLYEDINYSGICLGFQGSSFAFSSFAFQLENKVSSLKIKPGYSITLYENENYGGRSKTFTSDASYVGDDFNDLASSMRIIKNK